MFVLQNGPRATTGDIAEHGPAEGETKFDLTLAVAQTPRGLAACWEYATDLFDHPTIARMHEHWKTLLEHIVCDAEIDITRIPILTPAEREQILVGFNCTEQQLPAETTIHELFEA